jgi:tetrapyrrole methylase family protein/MazG family protein
MVRRHPHVFGDDQVENAEQVKDRWREIKRKEKNHQGSLMDSVPSGLPALMRAYRISERAAGIGFDWEDVQGVMDQVESEWSEFKHEMDDPENKTTDKDSPAALEFGDVLFTLVNVARMAGFHPETALQRSTAKFVDRFKSMEDEAARIGGGLASIPRNEMERLWEKVKSRQGSGG